MGNRGCLHDDRRRIRRSFVGRRWIHCVLEFKGRHRTVMTPQALHTELFFLDEATALAAGHRPCAECQRPRYLDFARTGPRRCRTALGRHRPRSTAIDRACCTPSGSSRAGAKRTYREQPARLPGGDGGRRRGARPYLVDEGRAAAVDAGRLRARPIADAGQALRVLTPQSIVRAIAHGFCGRRCHPSAASAPRRPCGRSSATR